MSWTCNFTINLNSALRIDTVSLSQSNGRTEYPSFLGKGWHRQWGRKGVKDVQWIATNSGNNLVTLQGRGLKGPSLFRYWTFSACALVLRSQGFNGDNFGIKGLVWVCPVWVWPCDPEQETPVFSEEPPCSGASWEHTNENSTNKEHAVSCHLSCRKGWFDSNIWWCLWENLGYFCNRTRQVLCSDWCCDSSTFGPCNVLSAHLSLYNCLNCCHQLMIANRSLTTENTWSQ